MRKIKLMVGYISVIMILIGGMIYYDKDSKVINVNVEELSNTKIAWGVKRASNHEQPDLGKKNMELMNQYNGIAIGNKDKKYVYLTFDGGYEAGYTEKILDALKENGVVATFFITGHYLNTAGDIVQRMVDEGHIVGNQFPTMVMYHF